MRVDWDTDKKYRIIYADPPWQYNSRSAHKKTKFGGGATGNYKCLSLDEIKSLPVGRLADDNSVLAMWVTGPHMHHGADVIRSWGFKYVETVLFVWVKTNRDGRAFYGPGFYTGSNAEYVLLGKRGKPAIIKRGVSQIILEPHRRDSAGKIVHSAKPECVRDKLTTLFGDLPRIELFARTTADGWDSLGDQLS